MQAHKYYRIMFSSQRQRMINIRTSKLALGQAVLNFFANFQPLLLINFESIYINLRPSLYNCLIMTALSA